MLSDEEIRRIEEDKRVLKKLRDQVKEKMPDNFYTPVLEERKKELIEIISKKRRLFSEAELKKKTYEELEEIYFNSYKDFVMDYMSNENGRVKAVD